MNNLNNSNEEVFLNRFDKFECHLNSNIFRYFFVNNSFVLETEFKGNCLITLDMREIYDFDDQGRIYNIYVKKGCIVIEYNKYLNNFLDNLNYKRYLVIKTNLDIDEKNSFQILNKWKEVLYQEDEKRKSYPWKLYIYEALKFKVDKKARFVFNYSENLDLAIEKVKSDFNKPYEEKTKFFNLKNDKISIEKSFAFNCAVKSFFDLYVKFDDNDVFGFYAGLPWFFQIWARDELISLKALKSIYEFEKNEIYIELGKKILLDRINKIDETGKLPNRFPLSELDSADATGWLYNRIFEFLEYFSQKELSNIREKLEKSVLSFKNNMQDYLIKNKANETWMDTSFENDTREGFRIEIQALWLSMLRLANYIDRLLIKKQTYYEFEEVVREKVKKDFFENGTLKDGKDDNTIRPNLFLACYVYPELLTKEEWESVFDKAIERLWLDWGGFSTIDKNHRLFSPYYTGEDNKSYHRGDSWFFLNNIAAICMCKINKEKYKSYIDKIIESSTYDILYDGAIARPSELSSANNQEANASLFQLWSAATYIELLTIYK
ncbi:MAG: amylo-alpha-1,6-glucosidase [Candidatus Woesearchaeota archaeon]